jgi:hypothetical protein
VRDFSLAKSVPALTTKNIMALILCFLKDGNITDRIVQSSKKIVQMFHHKTLSYEGTIIVILLLLAHQIFERS